MLWSTLLTLALATLSWLIRVIAADVSICWKPPLPLSVNQTATATSSRTSHMSGPRRMRLKSMAPERAPRPLPRYDRDNEALNGTSC